MAVLRFGVIGAGNAGVGTSRGDSFIRLLDSFDEAAVYDTHPENAGRAAKAADAQPFAELEPFLESGLDAIVVCSPIVFHAEQAATATKRPQAGMARASTGC